MAVTLDYGKCEQCGDNNVKTAELCRKCQVPLPWSKAAKQAGKAMTTHAGSPVAKMASQNVSLNLSTGFYVQILGGFIFMSAIAYYAACFMGYIHFVRGPGWILMAIGGAIWRAGAEMD